MTNSLENQPYNPAPPAPVAAGEPFSWGGLIGTIIIFLIILIAVFWLVKRLNNYSLRKMESSWVRVLDRQVLSGQQILYLVEIAGKIQIWGGTAHHLTKMEEINDPEIVADILEEIANRSQENVTALAAKLWEKFRDRKKKNQFSSELEHLLEEVNK